MTIESEMRALMAQTVFDRTAIGLQAVIPGAERATDAMMAQRGADQPLTPKVDQRPANELGDLPLFGDGHKQIEMF